MTDSDNLYRSYINTNKFFKKLLYKLHLQYLQPTIHSLIKKGERNDKKMYDILQKKVNDENSTVKSKFANYSLYKALSLAKFIKSQNLGHLTSYLDIGTGDGMNPKIISSEMDIKDSYCVDIEAPEFSFTFSGTCKYQTYDGMHLPYEDNKFDLITCFMVLHHVEHLNKLLSDIKRVMKNGGFLVIREHDSHKKIEPLLNVEHDFYTYLVNEHSLTTFGHEFRNFMSYPYLRNLLQSNGFQLVSKHSKQHNNIDATYYGVFKRI